MTNMKIKILILIFTIMTGAIPMVATAQLVESDHPYANNFAYTWPAITEPGATQMRLHFTKLDLSGYDVLRILDSNGNVLVNYGGGYSSYLQEDFWTEWFAVGTMKVRLETNGAGNAYGFLIDQKETRSTLAPITTYIAESYHPYANNFAYTWPAITEPGATQMRLHFTKLDLSGYDVLRILDSNGNVLVNYGGGYSSYLQEDFWTEWFAVGTMKVRLETNGAGNAYGFLIDQKETRPTLGSSITITSPNGGETWQRGTVHTVTWSYTGSPGANVKIELLKGGIVVGTVTSSTPNDGSQSWTPSPTSTLVGTDFKIRVTSTTNSAYTDVSDNNFAITPATSSSSIIVTSPNGGESWQAGTTHTITWSSLGSPGANVKIELLKNGAVVGTVASSTPNDGSQGWTISSGRTPGTDYKIRVTSTTNSACTDVSNSNFAITDTGTSSITVTSPNGGESWQAGTTHTITWSSLGSPGANVKIELLKNGAVVGTVASSTPNDGSQGWTISSGRTPGTDYKIRVTSTTNSAYTDMSNNNFVLTSSTSDRLNPGKSLKADEFIKSQDGRFTLYMQYDGNLVLYKYGTQVLWASGTNGKSASSVTMQNDGNLVINGPSGAIWATGTQGHSGAYLIVQNDGNVVIYDTGHNVLWNTGTSGK